MAKNAPFLVLKESLSPRAQESKTFQLLRWAEATLKEFCKLHDSGAPVISMRQVEGKKKKNRPSKVTRAAALSASWTESGRAFGSYSELEAADSTVHSHAVFVSSTKKKSISGIWRVPPGHDRGGLVGGGVPDEQQQREIDPAERRCPQAYPELPERFSSCWEARSP